MPNILVRDVPDDVVAALDARASRLGLSRSEYLRRRLAQETESDPRPVRPDHLATFAETFAETFADLADPEVMKGAYNEMAAAHDDAEDRLAIYNRAHDTVDLDKALAELN